jgi:hypothetical protein
MHVSIAEKVYEEAVSYASPTTNDVTSKGKEAMGILTDLAEAAKTFNDVAKELEILKKTA